MHPVTGLVEDALAGEEPGGLRASHGLLHRPHPVLLARAHRNRAAAAGDHHAVGAYVEIDIPGEQQIAMRMMDPNTLDLLRMVKDNLDPNGIMNPGNWEVG